MVFPFLNVVNSPHLKEMLHSLAGEEYIRCFGETLAHEDTRETGRCCCCYCTCIAHPSFVIWNNLLNIWFDLPLYDTFFFCFFFFANLKQGTRNLSKIHFYSCWRTRKWCALEQYPTWPWNLLQERSLCVVPRVHLSSMTQVLQLLISGCYCYSHLVFKW